MPVGIHPPGEERSTSFCYPLFVELEDLQTLVVY